MRPTAAMSLCLCVCLANGAGVLEARARQANDVERFRSRLLDAFARGDRRAVAGMVRYRLVVDAGGLIVPVMSRTDLVRMWDIVFPPEVRCMIEQSATPRAGQPAPKYAIRVDAGGGSFGDGRVRIDRGSDGLKITRLILPSGYGSGLAGKPRQVLFRWGKGTAAYRGRLSADNVDVYLVQARAGDLLNAQLERVRPEHASIRLVQQPGKRVLAAAGPTGSDARRLWAGRVPETGEYRVEVVRLGAYCDPAVNYQLKVSLE
jgi:hypothetical protein